MARRIPLPRLTRRQRSARWQRERRQQAVIVTVFSAVLFFVLGLVSWAASSKYYGENLKSAMTFDGRAVAMRNWTKEKAYELSRFYVEYGVPAGYENDPQIAQQKASFDRGALNTLEEYLVLDKQAKADGTTVTPEQVVLAVPLDVGLSESGCEPPLHHVVLRRTAALFDLNDVIAEVRLHWVRDLTDRERFRRVLERRDELALPHPAELTAGR